MHYEILIPALLVGFALGFGVALLFRIVQLKASKELAQSLIAQTKAESDESTQTLIGQMKDSFGNWSALALALIAQTKVESDQATQALVGQMKDSFGNLSVDALTKVSGEVVKLAGEKLAGQQKESVMDLESKKTLIDQQLGTMNTQLDSVQKLMHSLESDREQKFGELAAQLKTASQQTILLSQTASALREALASSRARGQWGERMADDVLRVSGLKEGFNYRRQTEQGTGNRPDFAFLLPHDLVLNMDVKFPIENYLKVIDAKDNGDVKQYTRSSVRDVRARVKEITTRDYIDEEHGTVSCVLLFVPIESVFAFAQESDPGLVDYALKQHVVLCSPSTLFAVLAVIHQAVDTFAVERRSKEMLAILGAFRKQWNRFVEEFDKLGSHIDQVNRDYTMLKNSRSRLLQKKIDDVDRLREQEGVALPQELSTSEVETELTAESESPGGN